MQPRALKTKKIVPEWALDEFYEDYSEYYDKPIYRKAETHKDECNLCGKMFQQKSNFEKFCRDCREENELYHSYNWN